MAKSKTYYESEWDDQSIPPDIPPNLNVKKCCKLYEFRGGPLDGARLETGGSVRSRHQVRGGIAVYRLEGVDPEFYRYVKTEWKTRQDPER